MVDPKDQKDPKDTNKQAPTDPQARPEKDEIAEAELDKVSGGIYSAGPIALRALGII